jgi:hypothetical protein
MNQEEPVKIGRINKATEKALGLSLGENIWVYVTSVDLDTMAKKWPEAYLSRLHEAGTIAKEPDYAAYRKEGNILYLVKEYLKNGSFVKVLLEIVGEPQWHLKAIYPLSAEKAKEIDEKYGIKRIV